MINITNPADCCGCSACASICNFDAITMKPDALGFLYPAINYDKCIDCGLCEKVCAFNEQYNTSLNFSEPIAYGARHKNMNEVMKSRSGAVFAAISDYFIENGGIVYGAGYTDHFRVVHKRATTKNARDEFRGSKYVQSDMNAVFRQVKKDLKDGLLVLFSGTPCQTSGLKSFVGEKLTGNLFLVDLVCHGVPSPYIWRDYLAYIENKYRSNIVKVDFREKSQYGWSSHKEVFLLESNSTSWLENVVNGESKWNTWYTKFFYDHIMFRHSCGNCHFCNTRRPSDITIADYWGWEKTGSDINSDNKGLNLVLLNTRKGEKIFAKIIDKLEIIKASPETYMQPNLRHPSKIHRKRMQFEKDYQEKGFDYVYNHIYHDHTIWKRVFFKAKRFIRKLIKK